MGDSYPPCFEIAIDRERLRKHLRTNWWVASLILLCLLGLFFGLVASSKGLEANPKPWLQMLLVFARNGAIGLCIGALMTMILDWLLLSPIATRYANTLRVWVEGPFLRIQEAWDAQTDRRLHFRAIVDYTLQQSPSAEWYPIESIVMTTTSGGQRSTVTIRGVKDGLKTRDLLSEVDRLREDAP